MKNSPTRDRDFYLWALLAQAKDAIQKARQRELDKYKISIWRSAALFRIEAIGEKATPAEISRWLLREPHSTSELLTRMEKEGLVKRVRDLDKKNLVRIVLTEKGREASEKSAEVGSLIEIFSCLTEEERRQLWSSLKKLRDKALKQIGVEEEISFPPEQWTMS